MDDNIFNIFSSDFDNGLEEELFTFNFDEKTGDFKMSGRASINSYLYNMLKLMATFQNISKENVDSIDSSYDKINNLISFLENKAERKNQKQNKVLPKNWIENAIKNNKKIFIYSDPVNYSSYDKAEVASLFLDPDKDINELNVRDLFFNYAIFYKLFMGFTEDLEIFKAAADAIGYDIEIIPIENTQPAYQILLRNRINHEVIIITFK